jgi:hypothetical protein
MPPLTPPLPRAGHTVTTPLPRRYLPVVPLARGQRYYGEVAAW